MSAPETTPSPRVVDIDTPHGPGRLHLDGIDATPPSSGRVLLVSHGAGNGIDTRDLEALAAALPARGIVVARFEQPWRVAGRPVAAPPATLDVGFAAAATRVAALLPGLPLVVGGRSAGARSACRTASALEALACVALAFPLHPPGKPESTRLPELLGSGVPTLVVQGERDPFGRPEEFPDLPAGHRLVTVPGADHGLKVGASAVPGQNAVLELVAAAVGEFVLAI